MAQIVRFMAWVILVLPITARLANAQFALDTDPSWNSEPLGHVASGGAWLDANADGWLDMAVANGNDIHRQSVVLYENNGQGVLPDYPTWESSDVDYHGLLDVGDINGDGWPDLAVAVYLGEGRLGDPGGVKIYLNDGEGSFPSAPSWISHERFFCFSVALGDADGDGDLDLACATGDYIRDLAEPQRVFFNDGGQLESVASWRSEEEGYSYDVSWGDIDGDGDLDLAFAFAGGPARLYLNHQVQGGGLATSSVWESEDVPTFSNGIAIGDVDGDNLPELAIADNAPYGSDGLFKFYSNDVIGLSRTPTWTSATGGRGSHVSWVDLDVDGDLDLFGARWLSALNIYENVAGTLSTAPAWQSSTSSIVEAAFWGDVDNDGLEEDGVAYGLGNGSRTLFPLGQSPVRSIESVMVSGDEIDPGSFSAHLVDGWVSLHPPPPSNSLVEVRFSYSTDLDLGITNWEGSKGNYLILNNSNTFFPDAPSAFENVRSAPNPFAHRTKLRYRGPSLRQVSIEIFDVRGRRVRDVYRGPVGRGLTTWEWAGVDDNGRRVRRGTFFVRFSGHGLERVIKVTAL